MGVPYYHKTSMVALLSKEESVFCRTLSNELGLDFGEYVPHVTLVTGEGGDANRLREALASTPLVDKYNGELQLEGLYIRKDNEDDRIWIGVIVKKDAELLALCDAVADNLGKQFNSESYFPHITLGRLASYRQFAKVTFATNLLERGVRTIGGCTLAAVSNGAYGKIDTIIARSK